VERKRNDLNINRGIELMLRRARKDSDPKPNKGFAFKRSFSLLGRKFKFNLELRWEHK